MKLMIEIPEDSYRFILQHGIKDTHEIDEVIANGTVITDDMISCEALKKEVEHLKETGYDTNNEPLFDFIELTTLFKLIDNAPSIGGNQNE